MKQYHLVKYKYGVGGKYTAFCLTPSLKEAKTVSHHGATFTITHKGAKSSLARHFQTPEAAQAWCASEQARVANPDWACIEGAAIWGQRAK